MSPRPAFRRLGGPPRHRRGRPPCRAAALAVAAIGATAALVGVAAVAGLGDLGGAAYGGAGAAPPAAPARVGAVQIGTAESAVAPTARIAAAQAAGGLTAGAPTIALPLTFPLPTARLAGADRYATAASVSAATFPGGAPIAYLATGADYPDALTAAAAAGGHGPVLLAGAGGVPSATLYELERLHPARVVVVGGTLVLPPSTEGAVRSVLPAAAVSRVQGPDRYATAALLSAATFGPPVSIAFLATGEAFPDALTAAAAAGGRGPVLLVSGTGMTAATSDELNRLQPRQVVIVGGASAVPASTQQLVTWVLRHSSVRRVAGADRYATAAAVAASAFPNGAATAYLATGTNFPDALTAAAAAGGKGPVLLVPSGVAPLAAAAEVHQLGPARVVLVGGTAAVSDASVAEALVGAVPTVSPTTVPPTTVPATAVHPATTVHPATSVHPATTHPPSTVAARPATTTATSVAGRLIATTTTTTWSPPWTTLPPPTVAVTTTTWPPPTITVIPTTVVLSPPPPPRATAAIAVQTAEAQIGKPYLWAGAGPNSFDCSGLTMFAWAAAGVQLPHNAAAQASLLPAVQPDTAHLAPGRPAVLRHPDRPCGRVRRQRDDGGGRPQRRTRPPGRDAHRGVGRRRQTLITGALASPRPSGRGFVHPRDRAEVGERGQIGMVGHHPHRVSVAPGRVARQLAVPPPVAVDAAWPPPSPARGRRRVRPGRAAAAPPRPTADRSAEVDARP